MSNDSYSVGRGKPPLATRFKPGVSGNPNGRPKRAPTLRHDLLDELARPVTAGGNHTNQRAVVRTLVAKAIAGNVQATSVLLAVLARIPDSNNEPEEEESLQDRKILERFSEREAMQPEKSDATCAPPGSKP